MRYDHNGTMEGFYTGGISHHGMSKKNITKLYRHALVLGGEDPVKAKKFTYHGTKRAGITFQKAFGGVSDRNVALGSKHAVGGIVSEYTDANKCQLAEPAKRQSDLRDKMEAVLNAKVGEKRTPPKRRVPGEISQPKNNVSPSEVRNMDSILNANGLDMTKLREVDRYHPGFMQCVLKLAASSVVGVSEYGEGIQMRAARYLKSKRRCVGRIDACEASRFSRNLVNPLCFESAKQAPLFGLSDYQARPVHPTIVYSGPVYNNCSFRIDPSGDAPVPVVRDVFESFRRPIVKKRRIVEEESIEQ